MTTVRRRSAGGLLTVVVLFAATVVFAASQADGREVSRVSSNDGGAWLLNREFGVVGHKNRAAEELSAFLRIPDSPAADVHQATNVVVVHDPDANQLLEIDPRNFAEDLQPTELPEFTQILTVDNTVLVVREAPLSVWSIRASELPTLRSLDGVPPVVQVDAEGLVTASPDGLTAVFDRDARAVRILELGGTRSGDNDDGGSDSGWMSVGVSGVVDITIVGQTAVLLTDIGDLHFVDLDGSHRTVDWDATTIDVPPMAMLQQPVEGHGRAIDVVGMNGGSIVRASVNREDEADAAVLAELAGDSPIAPIVHEGCTYAIVRQPAEFGIVCNGGTLNARPLAGSSQELRLRLVNGWIWVNDLEDGGVWITTDNLSIEAIDDWGLAAKAIPNEEPEEEGTNPATSAAERILVDDPDAVGAVGDDDNFDPLEVNVPPVPEDDEARTRVDRSIAVPVLQNDTDANNDILVVESVELINGDATVTRTPSLDSVQVSPEPGFVGRVEFTYSVSDGRSDPVPAFVVVEVVSDDVNNLAPVAETDVVATSPGNTTTIDVLINDIDPEGDALALTAITTDTGTLRWSATGQVTFTPDSTTSAGWVDLPYVVADDLGAQADGLLRVEIRDGGANQEPDARNDHATTVVDRPVTINLLANDTDPDGDSLVIGTRPTLLLPEGATPRITTRNDGEFVFTSSEPGTFIFSYTATDSARGGSERDTARVRIDVEDPDQNRPPVAVRDDVVIPIGGSRIVYVLDNDGDADGDAVGIVDWQPEAGLGIQEFRDDSGLIGFRVTVEPSAPERPSFVYSISDGVADPVSASVVVAVVPREDRNQPPLATNDVVSVRPGRTVVGLPVLANDFDPEGGALRIVSVSSIDEGLATVGANGQTLDLSVADDVASSFNLSYDITDDAGNRASAQVRVQLIPPGSPNRPPDARSDVARTPFDTPVAIRAMANDSDPDGDTIVLEGIVDQPANGTAEVSLISGVIEYRPDPGFSGTDLLRYSIVDADGERAVGQVLVGVMGETVANEPPIANDDLITPVTAGTGRVALDVLTNDFDPENDVLRVITVSPASAGTVQLEGGEVVFIPPDTVEELTAATFDYAITDGNDNQDSATVTVEVVPQERLDPDPTAEPTPVPTVAPTAEPTPVSQDELVAPDATPTPLPTSTPIPTSTPVPTATPTPVPVIPNAAPVAVNDSFGPVAAGTTVTIPALANDFDPDGEVADLTIISVSAPGTVDGANVVVPAIASTTQLNYVIQDLDGATATGTISVVVTENQPPTVAPLTVSTAFETPITINVGAQATDPDGDTLLFVCCAAIRDGGVDQVVAVPGELSVRFTPNDGFFGSAGFNYSVDDEQGHQLSGTVTITVEPPTNQPPTATDTTIQVPQRESTTVDLATLSDDADGDSLTWTIVSSTGAGVDVTLNGAIATVAASDAAAVGPTASFVFGVSDGDGTTEGVVSVDVVQAANTNPTATDTSIELAAGSAQTVNLVEFASDPDPTDTVSFSIDAANAGVIQAVLNGSALTLTPPVDAQGETGTVVFTATDNRDGADSGIVSITVAAPAAADPQAEDDSQTTAPATPVFIEVLANDSDPLGLGLTILTASASDGALTVASDGQRLRFDPGTFTGSTSGSYTIEDAAGRSAQATVSIETVGPPEAPAPPTVTASSGEAAISWTAPVRNGSEITGYIVEHSGGGREQVGLTNNYTWTGLTNGTAYTFTVIAINGIGESVPSSPSQSVTPDQIPDQPGAPTVEFKDGELWVSWTEPNNAGSAITGYELQIGGSASEVRSVSLVPGQPYQWKGLTNGAEYTFRVAATNQAGTSDLSVPSASEHPEARPGAPTIGTTSRGSLSGELIAGWTAPGSDGGGEILEYRVYIDGDPTPRPTLAGAGLTYNWSDLVNGQPRQFRVEARNRAGWGPSSELSNAIQACGRPSPVAVTAVKGDEQASLDLSSTDNGCAITNFAIVASGSNGEQLNASSTQAGAYTFMGLTNGVTYTFTASATNAQGAGDPGSPSAGVVPAGPPICGAGSPTATANGKGTVNLTWPVANENGAPTTYELTTNGGAAAQVPRPHSASGLADDTSYSFTVFAVNSEGSTNCGSANARTWAVPSPPTASLAWVRSTGILTATTSGGSSPDTPVTSWSATFSGGSGPDLQTGGGAPAGSFTTNPLSDGQYSFQLQICNVVGCVTSNTATQNVLLKAPPEPVAAPTLTHTVSAASVLEIFADLAEPDGNGAPILEYQVQWRRIGSSNTWHDFGPTTAPGGFLKLEERHDYNTAVYGNSPLNYEVWARARNSEGWGAYGPVATRTPPLPPPSVGTVSIAQGSASTGTCWHAPSIIAAGGTPSQGCYNIRITLSGWSGSHMVRCFSTMNTGVWQEFDSFTAGNGTTERCSYSLANRHVVVVVDGSVQGQPNQSRNVSPPAAASNIVGPWPGN